MLELLTAAAVRKSVNLPTKLATADGKSDTADSEVGPHSIVRVFVVAAVALLADQEQAGSQLELAAADGAATAAVADPERAVPAADVAPAVAADFQAALDEHGAALVAEAEAAGELIADVAAELGTVEPVSVEGRTAAVETDTAAAEEEVVSALAALAQLEDFGAEVPAQVVPRTVELSVDVEEADFEEFEEAGVEADRRRKAVAGNDEM